MSRYAISDIHGCAKTFRYLVEDKIKLTPADQLFLLGDYIDRGPDSKGVIDFILALRAEGYTVTTLMGNHEEMLLAALKDPEKEPIWLMNGGMATLDSFNTEQLADIPASYIRFFRELEYYKPLDGYLLVHAGFNFTAPDPFEDYRSMVWIRNFKPDEKHTRGRRIIHGHTPTLANYIMVNTTPPYPPAINIDGGCVYCNTPGGLGKLVALNLDTLVPTIVDNCED